MLSPAEEPSSPVAAPAAKTVLNEKLHEAFASHASRRTPVISRDRAFAEAAKLMKAEFGACSAVSQRAFHAAWLLYSSRLKGLGTADSSQPQQQSEDAEAAANGTETERSSRGGRVSFPAASADVLDIDIAKQVATAFMKHCANFHFPRGTAMGLARGTAIEARAGGIGHSTTQVRVAIPTDDLDSILGAVSFRRMATLTQPMREIVEIVVRDSLRGRKLLYFDEFLLIAVRVEWAARISRQVASATALEERALALVCFYNPDVSDAALKEYMDAVRVAHFKPTKGLQMKVAPPPGGPSSPLAGRSVMGSSSAALTSGRSSLMNRAGSGTKMSGTGRGNAPGSSATAAAPPKSDEALFQVLALGPRLYRVRSAVLIETPLENYQQSKVVAQLQSWVAVSKLLPPEYGECDAWALACLVGGESEAFCEAEHFVKLVDKLHDIYSSHFSTATNPWRSQPVPRVMLTSKIARELGIDVPNASALADLKWACSDSASQVRANAGVTLAELLTWGREAGEEWQRFKSSILNATAKPASSAVSEAAANRQNREPGSSSGDATLAKTLTMTPALLADVPRAALVDRCMDVCGDAAKAGKMVDLIVASARTSRLRNEKSKGTSFSSPARSASLAASADERFTFSDFATVARAQRLPLCQLAVLAPAALTAVLAGAERAAIPLLPRDGSSSDGASGPAHSRWFAGACVGLAVDAWLAAQGPAGDRDASARDERRAGDPGGAGAAHQLSGFSVAAGLASLSLAVDTSIARDAVENALRRTGTSRSATEDGAPGWLAAFREQCAHVIVALSIVAEVVVRVTGHCSEVLPQHAWPVDDLSELLIAATNPETTVVPAEWAAIRRAVTHCALPSLASPTSVVARSGGPEAPQHSDGHVLTFLAAAAVAEVVSSLRLTFDGWLQSAEDDGLDVTGGGGNAGPTIGASATLSTSQSDAPGSLASSMRAARSPRTSMAVTPRTPGALMRAVVAEASKAGADGQADTPSATKLLLRRAAASVSRADTGGSVHDAECAWSDRLPAELTSQLASELIAAAAGIISLDVEEGSFMSNAVSELQSRVTRVAPSGALSFSGYLALVADPHFGPALDELANMCRTIAGVRAAAEVEQGINPTITLQQLPLLLADAGVLCGTHKPAMADIYPDSVASLAGWRRPSSSGEGQEADSAAEESRACTHDFVFSWCSAVRNDVNPVLRRHTAAITALGGAGLRATCAGADAGATWHRRFSVLARSHTCASELLKKKYAFTDVYHSLPLPTSVDSVLHARHVASVVEELLAAESEGSPARGAAALKAVSASCVISMLPDTDVKDDSSAAMIADVASRVYEAFSKEFSKQREESLASGGSASVRLASAPGVRAFTALRKALLTTYLWRSESDSPSKGFGGLCQISSGAILESASGSSSSDDDDDDDGFTFGASAGGLSAVWSTREGLVHEIERVCADVELDEAVGHLLRGDDSWSDKADEVNSLSGSSSSSSSIDPEVTQRVPADESRGSFARPPEVEASALQGVFSREEAAFVLSRLLHQRWHVPKPSTREKDGGAAFTWRDFAPLRYLIEQRFEANVLMPVRSPVHSRTQSFVTDISAWSEDETVPLYVLRAMAVELHEIATQLLGQATVAMLRAEAFGLLTLGGGTAVDPELQQAVYDHVAARFAEFSDTEATVPVERALAFSLDIRLLRHTFESCGGSLPPRLWSVVTDGLSAASFGMSSLAVRVVAASARPVPEDVATMESVSPLCDFGITRLGIDSRCGLAQLVRGLTISWRAANAEP